MQFFSVRSFLVLEIDLFCLESFANHIISNHFLFSLLYFEILLNKLLIKLRGIDKILIIEYFLTETLDFPRNKCVIFLKSLPVEKSSANYERFIKTIKYLKMTAGQDHLDIKYSKYETSLVWCNPSCPSNV